MGGRGRTGETHGETSGRLINWSVWMKDSRRRERRGFHVDVVAVVSLSAVITTNTSLSELQTPN